MTKRESQELGNGTFVKRARLEYSGPTKPVVSDLDTTIPWARTPPAQTVTSTPLADSPLTATEKYGLCDEEEDSSEAEDEDQIAGRHVKETRVRYMEGVIMASPAYPRSAYQGWESSIDPVSECEAHAALASASEPQSDGCYYFQLDSFNIYCQASSRTHGLELISLDRLGRKYAALLFDGVLSAGSKRRYVQGVPFGILTVEGYGDPDITDMGDQLCIQSLSGRKGSGQTDGKPVWYRLGQPSAEYLRYHRPFLWLVRFAKYFVEYLMDHEAVTLSHFRNRFYEWLCKRYSGPHFTSWHSQANYRKDFCCQVAVHQPFLWKEAYDLHESNHPVWAEIDQQHPHAIPAEPNHEKRTIVTPFAFQVFGGMYFGDQLEERLITDQKLLDDIRLRKQQLHLTPLLHRRPKSSTSLSTLPTPLSLSINDDDAYFEGKVSVGDVVCVRPDLNTKWRNAGEYWFAYVQDTRQLEQRNLLDVLWLYEPKDTTMGKTFYPFPNELFLSDNCSCGKDALDLDCVVTKLSVNWYPSDPSAESKPFIRRKFRTIHDNDTYDFVTIQASDFLCGCQDKTPMFEECQRKYQIGDTVLVREWDRRIQDDRLQPAQVIGFDIARRRVQLRRFLRKGEQDGSNRARANELLSTFETYDKSADKIVRRCHVRYFSKEQVDASEISAPYNRDGTGDFFFLVGSPYNRHNDAVADRFLPNPDGEITYGHDLPQFLLPLHEGWDPREAGTATPKLTGLGIFCGGGNLDYGLEEGGAVEFRYAVDWAKHALHSYRANLDDSSRVEFFLGSVNDYLAQALSSRFQRNIARPGEISLLSAGSPCPGFSTLNNSKLSDLSRRNASMVASVIAFVDFYAPEYFILENVATMTHGMGPKKDENVFAQIVAAMVGLGYQVQQFLAESGCFGSAQQRPRIFIVASAPGLSPFEPLQHSHSHPVYTKLAKRALGTSSNGLPFGSRRHDYTPFNSRTAAEAVSDLPYLGDAQPDICPRFPDHRTCWNESATNRTRMAVVPVRPRGDGLTQANRRGLICGEPSNKCERLNHVRAGKNSKYFSRLHPDRLFPTVVTRIMAGDGIGGRVIHWDQHRTMTIMESKRAQGYLDHEVIVGAPPQQQIIIGNSVDRKVSLVLGLSLRESWMEHKHARVIDDLEAMASLGGGVGDHLRPTLHVGGPGRKKEQEQGQTQDDVESVFMSDDDGHARDNDNDDDDDDGDGKAREKVDEMDMEGRNDDEDEDDARQESVDPLTEMQDVAYQIDNRAAKMALFHLGPCEKEEVKISSFKAIKRILQKRTSI